MEDRDIIFFKKITFLFQISLHDTFTVFLVNFSYLFIAFETQNSLQQ